MIRYLTKRPPIMICPRWVFTRTQPLSIRDGLDYLMATLSHPQSARRIIEIGGAEVVTYGEMMMIYAEVRGLRRWMVTPIPAVIAADSYCTNDFRFGQ